MLPTNIELARSYVAPQAYSRDWDIPGIFVVAPVPGRGEEQHGDSPEGRPGAHGQGSEAGARAQPRST